MRVCPLRSRRPRARFAAEFLSAETIKTLVKAQHKLIRYDIKLIQESHHWKADDEEVKEEAAAARAVSARSLLRELDANKARDAYRDDATMVAPDCSRKSGVVASRQGDRCVCHRVSRPGDDARRVVRIAAAREQSVRTGRWVGGSSARRGQRRTA